MVFVRRALRVRVLVWPVRREPVRTRRAASAAMLVRLQVHDTLGNLTKASPIDRHVRSDCHP
jgi:hypothetical protein